MALFDTETVLKNAVAVVKDKLPAIITAINTEKNDFAISSIPSSAYYFAQLPKAFNYNTFIVYGFSGDPQLSANQSDNHIKSVSLYFEVVTVDGGSKDEENIIYKLLRYGRALEEVFHKNSSKIMEGYGTLEISALSPTNIMSLEGKTVRSAGVSVTAKITAR